MSTDTELVTKTLVDDGRKLMELGNKQAAHSHFVMATQFHPDDEELWMLRGETADDPREATECFERVMELNPDNHTAREKLVFVRLNNLQQEARSSQDDHRSVQSTNATGFSFRGLVAIFTLFFLIVSILGIGVIALVWQFLSVSPDTAQSAQEVSTAVALVFPQTWTPVPTRTPLPDFTPVVRQSWKITKDTTVRAGPSTSFEKLGTLSKDAQVYIVGRTKDGKFIQIEYPDANHLVWIAIDSAQIGSDELTAIAVTASAATPAPPVIKNVVVPTVKPSATPLPPFDFMPASAARSFADCNKQTGVYGMVYNSATNGQPINGVLVRVNAFGQLQNTVQTGVKGRSGYWEWYFTNNTEVIGDIAIVNSDGSLQSQLINFHLTSCYGANPANQFTVDFARAR